MNCCICGKPIVTWGNDPWPVNTRPDALCCDECNFNVVIPERIRRINKDVHNKA